MVGILGGWVVGVLMIGVDPGAFWSQMQNGVDVWNDVLNGVIKSLVFGVTVTLVSLYEGWQAAHARGRGPCHHTHRGGGIAGGAGPGFPAYGLDVWKLIRIDHVTRKTDFWVGLFVLLGAAALAFLALRAGNLSASPSRPPIPSRRTSITWAASRCARPSRAPAWWWGGSPASPSTTRPSRRWCPSTLRRPTSSPGLVGRHPDVRPAGRTVPGPDAGQRGRELCRGRQNPLYPKRRRARAADQQVPLRIGRKAGSGGAQEPAKTPAN